MKWSQTALNALSTFEATWEEIKTHIENTGSQVVIKTNSKAVLMWK